MGLQESINSNKAKTIALIICFPVLLYVICYIIFRIINGNSTEAIKETMDISLTLSIIITIIGTISLLLQKKVIFGSTGAKEITRKDNPEIYNIVENLCISKGIQTPKVGIIEDSSMNAFATGRSEKDSWIVFTTGLLNNLEKREIEAVAGHELTHIINRDCRLMAVIVVYVGVISTIGQILIRNTYSSNSNKKGNIFAIVGIVCLVLGYLFYPLIRLAISRKREYLADAGSVILTQDNQAMISALKKISGDPAVSTINNSSIAAMCIENPLGKAKKLFENLTSTHPSIEDRIAALNKYIVKD